MIRIAFPIIEEAEKLSVLSVLESGNLIQGKIVGEFEEKFAEYCGVNYAVAVSSGTAALHLTLLAHGIGKNDEVITTPFSFVATANAILAAGARPVFADIEKDTFNLDPEKVVEKINSKTKAIIPVHLYGHPADMNSFSDIAGKYKLRLIEDACQAHGALYRSKMVGSFGTGCFSFYATKNMTSAEGGMVTTNDPIVVEKIKLLRNHGMSKKYHCNMLGYNYRMTDLHAAIGLVQLFKLEKFNKLRRQNASFLTARLRNFVKCPVVRKGCTHVFHQYTIRAGDSRDRLQQKLHKEGIEAVIYYPIPIHKQEFYRQLGYGRQSYPGAEKACRESLSIPVHPSLSENDLNAMISIIMNIFHK